MAQCLPQKHEHLSSGPVCPCKARCISNLQAGRKQIDDPWSSAILVNMGDMGGGRGEGRREQQYKQEKLEKRREMKN